MTEPNTGNNSAKKRRKDTRQCRICLAGSEEEEELGPLIRPCKCKGSIRYVHVQCINTWRGTGNATNSRFWQCMQCGHKYNISRTKILGLSNSPWVLVPTTIALFLVIVFAASFAVSFFLPELDDPMLIVPPPASYPNDPGVNIGGMTWHTPIGIAGDFIRETVHAFAEVSTPRDVIFEARRRESLRNVEDTTAWGKFKKRIPFRGVGKVDQNKKARPGTIRIDPRAPYSPSRDRPRITFWNRILRKFMLGLSLVGILSFLNLLITMSLFGPLQIARARWIRGRREPGNVRDIGTILIIIFVLIGVARALYGVYNMTLVVAQYALQKAESAILEVQDDDGPEEEEEEEEAEPDPKEDTSDPLVDKPADGIADGAATTTATESVDRKARQRPGPLNLNNARVRNPTDDFGEELPDTPGGWKEEWNI